MKKYHVYGVGNALVDMEFEVEPDYLSKMGIEKGLMTLVDEQRQSFLMTHLDGIQHKRSCGGSAANTMIALAQFGARSFYSCKVANDETGDFYFKDLVESGVATNLSDKREGGITGKCLVMITPDADRTMNTFLGITQNFSVKELVPQEIANSEFLYIEGYLVASPTGIEAALKAKDVARESQVKVALTFSDVSMVNYFRNGIDSLLNGGVDLLFCNEAEALAYCQVDNVKDAFVKLKEVAKAFCVTLGPKGAFVFDGKNEIYVVTTPVDAVDTNGAGDLFAGAVLYGITHGQSFAEAARLGCVASGELVQHFGARLKLEQIQKIKKRVLA